MARKKQKPKRPEDPNALIDVAGVKRTQGREQREAMAVESSEMALQEHGIRGGDPDYRQLQVYLMVTRLGIAKTRAAELCGFDRVTGQRIMLRAKTNPRFKAKVDGLIDRMTEGYRMHIATRLPDIAELDVLGLDQYRKDPSKLLDKPQFLKHLRGAIGIGSGDGVQVNNQVNISIEQIERLQRAIQADVQAIEIIKTGG
jgi:hypothetical protein